MLSRWLVLILFGACVANTALAMNLYRFKIDGRTELKDHIPAEYAGYGYEILNTKGQVVKVVPRAPTAEEIAARKAREQAEKLHAQRIAELTQSDKNLLRLYAHPDDVERARLRKSEEINTYVGLQNRRLEGLGEKLEQAQIRAARFQQGGTVPDDIAQELAELKSAIQETQKDIQDRQEELQRITKSYGKQHKRLRILQTYPPGTLEEEVDFSRLN